MEIALDFNNIRFAEIVMGSAIVELTSNILRHRGRVNNDRKFFQCVVVLYFYQTLRAVFLGHIEIEEKDIRKAFGILRKVPHQLFAIFHRNEPGRSRECP